MVSLLTLEELGHRIMIIELPPPESAYGYRDPQFKVSKNDVNNYAQFESKHISIYIHI